MSLPDTAVAPASSAPLLKPTRVRYGVLGFACALSMITYLDRASIATVAGYIQSEFGLSHTQRGYLFGAFTLAYALFEVPSGWLGDVFGPRRTLIRIVLWWSVFTALTGVIYPGDTPFLAFLGLLVVRFMFGMGEAGAYPNIARAFHNWFPFEERGFAKGTVWMAGRFAGGITHFIVLALIFRSATTDGAEVVHWRHTFWIFALLGAGWCILWAWWFRDQPEDHPSINRAEVDMIRAGHHADSHARVRVPWKTLLLSGNLWLLCGMYFCSSYGWYFNLTYLPAFLKDHFRLAEGDKWTASWWQFSLMAGLPLLLGSLACLAGGVLTDTLIRRTGNRTWGRRLPGMVGHGVCAVCYFIALIAIREAPAGTQQELGYAWFFTLSIGLAAFFNDMTMGSSWASCIDIGGRYSGVVAGCMNTIGNLGGFSANLMTGWILDLSTGELPKTAEGYPAALMGGWTVNFIIFGCVYVMAALLWSRFDAARPVAPDANA